MIYTSNFANLKNLDKEKCISIARGTPSFFNGEICLSLLPTWNMIMDHKNKKITDEQYTLLYYEILKKIDPQEIIDKYDEKIFLCWCAKNKFCHRHIVTEWLNKYKSGICKEI